jgi:hypothetical protein
MLRPMSRRVSILPELVLLLVSGGLVAQTVPELAKPTLEQALSDAYTYCKREQQMLNLVRELHPDLTPQVKEAEGAWGSTFGPAEGALEQRLKTLLREKGPKQAERTSADAAAAVKDLPATMDRKQAVNFLEEMKGRVKGQIASPVREMLLANLPAYVKAPEREFTDGFTQSFSTKTHPKAAGHDITLTLPSSWRGEDMSEPMLVHRWVCDAGYGTALISMSMAHAGAVPTKEEREMFFSEDGAKQMMGEEHVLMNLTKREVNGITMGVVHSRQVPPTGEEDTDPGVHALMYFFLDGDYAVVLEVVSLADGGAVANQERIRILEPLIEKVMASVKIGK